jgi:Uma2 family endonuclease
MVRYREGVVQLADGAYFSWDRFPNRRLPHDAVSRIVPDIAIEVLSRSNTAAEMQRKRHEYFDAGVSLVWIIDHRARTVTVFTTPEDSRTFAENDILDGGTVLPEFTLLVKDLFVDLDR